MAQFNYNDYQNAVERAQNASNATKIGFFKLGDDGASALVRINCSKLEDLQFASVHQLGAAQKWMKVSCLNPIGSTDKCPLCEVVKNDPSKSSMAAKKKVYVQMLASYQDPVTGQWSQPVPVIWERPAGFSRDICTKLAEYGDLKQTLFKVVRHGKAGDMQTTYSIDYAMPTVYKPELVPADFSAFNNFNINKHSYWEKTAEEINTFLATGSFPEVIKTNTTVAGQAQVVAGPAVQASAPVVTPVATPVVTEAVQQQATASTASVGTSVQAPAQNPVEPPVRTFEKFTF